MATIKIKYRPSTVYGREGSVCYQVIHNRQTRLITTSYKLFPTEWDEARSVPMQGSDNAERDCYLSALANRMEEDLRRLDFIVRKLERSGSYTAEQVVSAYLRADNYESSFFGSVRKPGCIQFSRISYHAHSLDNLNKKNGISATPLN